MTGLRALLVEDDPADAARIAEVVTRCGAVQRLALAPNRAEAMRLLAREPFDLVLVDLNLPDSQGFATVESFVQARPELPLVVVSGFGDGDLVLAAEALRRGAQDFLPKSTVEGLDLTRALVLARARKRGERERLAAQGRDPTTGLPDLAAFRCAFERARLRALRHGTHLGLGLFTVADLWVRVRDWGEDYVHTLERALAGILHRTMRRTDDLARVAPGCFVLLFEEIRDEGALETALRRIHAHALRALAERAGETVPLSRAGALVVPHEPVGLELLLARLQARVRAQEGEEASAPGPPAASVRDGR